MESFVVIDELLASVPGSVVTRLSRVDVGRGREDLFRHQLPSLLTELSTRARIESVTASSALEGVVVADSKRAHKIVVDGATVLRNRSEQEFAGYRSTLDYLFTQEWRPMNIGLVLHLHRLLYTHTAMPAGAFKTDDNLVVDRSSDGSVNVRFRPVSANRTEYYVHELVERYAAEQVRAAHHPVLLVGLFVLDLLTIHPFADGNGRVARALTNALLADCGYGVGRYVSLERQIASTAEDYYDSLLASTRGWHTREHDPWPWLTYFTATVMAAYEDFEQRALTQPAMGTKQDRVRAWVVDMAPAVFRLADARSALPGISDNTIRLVLESLKADGRVRPDGSGRGAVWRKSS
ncbi:MAG: Fic family protein [Mobilicoccus sp.]|nr:Fic family protein [Mobilicoccus sp.]